MIELRVDLPDTEKPALARNVRIEPSKDAILIRVEGYGDAVSQPDDGVPVLLEVHHGEPRLIVWADINQEDPTHIISLEGARQDRRIED